jgi:hypothetical protein
MDIVANTGCDFQQIGINGRKARLDELGKGAESPQAATLQTRARYESKPKLAIPHAAGSFLVMLAAAFALEFRSMKMIHQHQIAA